jgi:hypothetical protein
MDTRAESDFISRATVENNKRQKFKAKLNLMFVWLTSNPSLQMRSTVEIDGKISLQW